jgi:hypothetical protein
MSRVIFSAEYQVDDDKLDIYLEKIAKLKTLLSGREYEYFVFRDEKRKNYFEEIYIFKNVEDFENFDDVPTEEIGSLVYDITSNCVIDKKVQYKTLYEVD